jgi:prepilin-type N-terminal cleavage/methylation domain-containing protein
MHKHTRNEKGMTLIEVMVTMVVLTVGVLGSMTMLDTGNDVTAENLARDGAMGLAREQIEEAREISYPSLTQPIAAATAMAPKLHGTNLGSLLSTVTTLVQGAPAVAAATFTTQRRSVDYSSTLTTCVIDDPADGIGTTTGTSCNPLPASSGGGGTSSSGAGASTPGLNVLGILITGGGTLTQALCSLIGPNSILNALLGSTVSALTGLVSTGADVGLCPNTTQQVAIDRTPNDAIAVTTVVNWSTPAPGGQITQRSIVSGPRV